MTVSVHVVPDGGGWKIVASGVDTQRHAVATARKLARKLHGELVLHGESGVIRAKDSEGNDPPTVPG